MLILDHLAVAAEDLATGVAYVESALGVKMSAGGEHPLMGTHNRLLGLADGLYLEVITINPAAPESPHPRWFDLDNFRGTPRLTNWVVRTDNINTAVTHSPEGVGIPMALNRGDLRWKMAVPENGKLPFGGAFPALIEWEGDAHPAARLPQSGCRLCKFEIFHPKAIELRAVMGGLFEDDRVSIEEASKISFRAEFETPDGVRVLK
ncbi:VOC family protein [Pseudohalocynthiibacter aestuariivivens]|jgi:Glyoxalase-like domain|uniref:VOC family protein n=1 Tax=Pseudohalocynthiibacter aestuariivivens TaxID=1591409 RepID=A0ABV5JD62_9RHOB|nr:MULTISPECIES: VOC family protein [Pseudohalocynthiibacter]MBS9715751.1 VOC family protein [Pseudohalocynthiibacter aestuariivivens]MCK0101364.1 VOC family protein [Pseudohalocynthiibacter sp. F2068]